MMTVMPYITFAIRALLGFFGGYFKAYATKKGENRAMQEDIHKLTTITKEIEAKISGELWDRQKQWELKRDILYGAAKAINEVNDKLLALSTMWQHKVDG